ncbi:MAG: aldolase [Candidatus Hydrogenedentes bacterium]|nr:aldolase [Candidatus Hydrogenedentota bacterium]
MVNSIKLNLSDARAAEIAAMCGADSVWLDLEHVPNTLQDIENQIRAAKIYDCDAMVRVKRGSYSDLICPLEMDAAGIMVPHVMSGEEAKEIAWRTRFQPIGRRPMDGGNADGAYCGIPVKDYMEQANRERFVVLQIEDPEALDELDKMAQVDGIDMLFFGPGDFSHAIGVAGQIDHPEVQAAYKQVADACKRHGKFSGTAAPWTQLEKYAAMGFQFIGGGADVLALTDEFKKIVEAYRALD